MNCEVTIDTFHNLMYMYIKYSFFLVLGKQQGLIVNDGLFSRLKYKMKHTFSYKHNTKYYQAKEFLSIVTIT